MRVLFAAVVCAFCLTVLVDGAALNPPPLAKILHNMIPREIKEAGELVSSQQMEKVKKWEGDKLFIQWILWHFASKFERLRGSIAAYLPKLDGTVSDTKVFSDVLDKDIKNTFLNLKGRTKFEAKHHCKFKLPLSGSKDAVDPKKVEALNACPIDSQLPKLVESDLTALVNMKDDELKPLTVNEGLPWAKIKSVFSEALIRVVAYFNAALGACRHNGRMCDAAAKLQESLDVIQTLTAEFDRVTPLAEKYYQPK